MHSGQTYMEGEMSSCPLNWERGAARFDSKDTLKQKQRGSAVQNKAEVKQHNQNTVITLVWSVIQVKIITSRLTSVKTIGKTTRALRAQTTHGGNVLAISTVSRFTVTTKAG